MENLIPYIIVYASLGLITAFIFIIIDIVEKNHRNKVRRKTGSNFIDENENHEFAAYFLFTLACLITWPYAYYLLLKERFLL